MNREGQSTACDEQLTPYKWKKADGRKYERLTYGLEGLTSWGADRCPAKYYATMVNGVAITYTPSAAASSLDTDFASRARSAWTALRYETPTLASRVTRVDGGSGALDYKLCYTAPTQAEEVEAWARATLVHVPTPQTMQDLLYALNSQEVLDKVRPDERNYAANMYYCQGPNRGEYNICFVNCHSVLDARGYFRCQQRFFELMLETDPAHSVALDWGNEVDNLTLPYEYEAGLRAAGDACPDGLMDMLQGAQAFALATEPYCRLPQKISVPGTTTARVALKRIDFPASVATAIQKVAKAHETRFSYIVSACVLLAVSANCENPEDAKAAISPFAPVDARSWFADQAKAKGFRGSAYYGGSTLAVSTDVARQFHIALDVTGQLSSHFWQAVQAVHDAWDGMRTSKAVASLQNEFLQAISPGLSDTGNLLKATVQQSSLGRVQDYLAKAIVSPDGEGRVEVKDILSTTYFATSRALGVLYWTHGDTFSITSTYDVDRFDEEVIDSLYADIKRYISLVAAEAAE